MQFWWGVWDHKEALALSFDIPWTRTDKTVYRQLE